MKTNQTDFAPVALKDTAAERARSSSSSTPVQTHPLKEGRVAAERSGSRGSSSAGSRAHSLFSESSEAAVPPVSVPGPSRTLDVQTTASTATRAASRVGSSSKTAASVNAILEKRLAALEVAGVSATLIGPDGQTVSGTAGKSNVEKNQAVDPSNIFSWASVSKTVVAAAAMKLVEDTKCNPEGKKFDLDAPIEDYLGFDIAGPNAGEPITMRQLLTHTSSIKDNESVYDGSFVAGDSKIALGDWLEGYLTPDGKLSKELYNEKENFKAGKPGEYEHEYSNIGTALAALAIERFSGQDFAQYTEEKLFEPLGMKDTSWKLADVPKDRLAENYFPGDEEGTWEVAGHQGMPTYPDGAIRSTSTDMARFLAMVSSGGELDGQRVLSKESVAEMLKTPQVGAKGAEEQGLSFYKDTFGPHEVIGHDGSENANAGHMYFTEEGFGVAVVANGDWDETDETSEQAQAMVEDLLTEAKRLWGS